MNRSLKVIIEENSRVSKVKFLKSILKSDYVDKRQITDKVSKTIFQLKFGNGRMVMDVLASLKEQTTILVATHDESVLE